MFLIRHVFLNPTLGLITISSGMVITLTSWDALHGLEGFVPPDPPELPEPPEPPVLLELDVCVGIGVKDGGSGV